MAEASVRGPLQVAISTSGVGDLLQVARRHAPGGTTILAGVVDSSPLLADRPPVDGREAAYVCRGFVCDRPVTAEQDLIDALTRR